MPVAGLLPASDDRDVGLLVALRGDVQGLGEYRPYRFIHVIARCRHPFQPV